MTNRKQVFDNIRGNKDIVEAKESRKDGVTGAYHGKGGTVANNNGRGKRRER